MKFESATRCINCKTEVKSSEQEKCTKCGDPVKARPRVVWAPGDASRLQAHVDEIVGAPPIVRADWPVKRVLDEAVDSVTSLQLDGAVAAPGARATVRPESARPVDPFTTPSGVNLTGEQAAAVTKVKDWFRRDPTQPFRLFGPAGTGKTTLAKVLPAALGVNIVFGAYTGKAAHVLRKKGVPATTIHSAIYWPVDNSEVRAEWEEACRELAELKTDPVIEAADTVIEQRARDLEVEIRTLEAQMRRKGFELNPMSEWAHADLIVLDEVSMVNAKMAADIESFGVPVLVLGDPAQLPPIEGGGHYTLATPDVLLETIHRQALESPVLALATQIRVTGGWAEHRVPVSLETAMQADQVLCWKNSTRWSLIERMRAKRGRPRGMPVAGDRIMCIVNNRDAGLFNGQQFEVLGAEWFGGSDVWTLAVRDDEGHEREVLAYPDGFRGLAGEKTGKDTLNAYRGRAGLFTFADAITVHKAQGSEWDEVYVVDQTHQMTRSTAAEIRAWAYTAVSRASEKVTIASTEVR